MNKLEKDIEDILLRTMQKRQQRHPQKYFGIDIAKYSRNAARLIAEKQYNDDGVMEAIEGLIKGIEEGNTTMPQSQAILQGGGHA